MDIPTANISSPEKNSVRRPVFILVAVVIVAAASIAGWKYWLAYQTRLANERNEQFLKNLESIDTEYHRMGDFDGSIAELEKLNSQVSTLRGTSRDYATIKVQLRLAANYIARNNPGDKEKAMEIYRSLVGDESLSNGSRAIALAEMASVAHWINGAESVRGLIFAQPPYDQILKDQNGDIHLAIEKLYEMSDKLYPNALSKLQMALMLTVHLVNMPAMTKEEKAAMAEKIYQYIQDGDALLASGAIPYENGYLTHMQYCRAMSLGALYRVMPERVTTDMVEEGFKRTLELAEDNPKDFYPRSIAVTARINYASFIQVTATSSQARVKDITELMSIYSPGSVTDPDFRFTNMYLMAVAERPESDFFKGRARLLAGNQPNFKAYLEALGWKFN